MAKRFLSTLTLGLIGSLLAVVVGCQPQTTGPSAYVPPTFGPPRLADGPQLVAVPPPPVLASPPPRTARVVPPLPQPRKQSRVAFVPPAWVPPVTPRPWKWIVIHHSDTERGSLAFIDRLHKDKGWDGVGYDFVIGNGTDTADGAIEVGYRWTQQSVGAHTKTSDNRFNQFGIGICLVGNMMDHPPTPKQLAAVERLSAYLMDTYHIAPDHIMGHGDCKPTDCPGRYTNLTLIRSIATREAGGLAAIAGTPYRHPAGEMLVQVTDPR